MLKYKFAIFAKFAKFALNSTGVSRLFGTFCAFWEDYQIRRDIEDVEVPLCWEKLQCSSSTAHRPSGRLILWSFLERFAVRGTSLSRCLWPSCAPLRGHFCFWYSFPHTGLAADSCCSLRQAKGFTNYANCLVSPGRVHDPASPRSCRKTEGW